MQERERSGTLSCSSTCDNRLAQDECSVCQEVRTVFLKSEVLVLGM